MGENAPSPVYTHSLGKHAPITHDSQSSWDHAPSTLYTQSVGLHTADHVTTDNENAFKDEDQTQTQGTFFFHFNKIICL